MVETNLRRQQAQGRLLIIGTALFWGLAGVCVKSIPWNSMSIMAARCGVGIIMLGINKKSFKLSFEKHTFLGAVMTSLTGILYMMSIKLTTAATAIVLQYIAPILVFIFTVIVQKVKPKMIETAIVIAVFGGCFLSFADKLDATHIIGNLLGLLSGITFAGQIIIFSDKKADSAEGMYLSNVMSFAVCFPFMFFDKNMTFDKRTLFWVFILAVFQFGVANICYARGCQKINKIETSLLLTIEPIFNPIPVWLVTGEKPGTLALIGFAVVIIAVTVYGLLPVIEMRKENAA